MSLWYLFVSINKENLFKYKDYSLFFIFKFFFFCREGESERKKISKFKKYGEIETETQIYAGEAITLVQLNYWGILWNKLKAKSIRY